MFDKVNMNLLIECAHTARDVATRNHVFLLLSSVAKVSSRWISEHIIDIFTVIGESAVKQVGHHVSKLNVVSVIWTAFNFVAFLEML